MRYVVETWWQETGKDPDNRVHGLYAFKESAEHAGEILTKAGGPEAFRLFKVHEVAHSGPSSLSEWLLRVRSEIEIQFDAVYNVNNDKFYEDFSWEDEEDAANAAYKGAKLAMQLLEVQ